MQVLRAQDYKRSPWKNGGGETREIAVFPEGAGMADFDWRLSMALVASDGPFSTFPGIERTLTILSGGPMELTIDSQPAARLGADTKPLSFPADIPVFARLLGPSVTDLNVMTRTGVFTHRVDVIALAGIVHSLPAGAIRAVLCMEGSVDIRAGQVTDRLGHQDCCLLAAHEGKAHLEGSGKAAVITIQAP